MPIELDFPIVQTASTIRLQGNLGPRNCVDFVTWWYNGLYKNDGENTQPSALVTFRPVVNGIISDEVVPRRLPLTTLGQVRIGSIWRDGQCQSEIHYPERKFNVIFHKNHYRIVNFFDSFIKNITPPFPINIYPLNYARDKNWLIEFELESGGKLLIPCLEFFSRCYGRSQEIKRVLASYPWHDQDNLYDSKLYAPIDEEENGPWKVKLRKKMVNGDVIFLAYAKYDRYSEWAAKSIYAQIEAGYNPKKKDPTFIRVAPWFIEHAEISVRGIPFDDGRSFLGLRVVGCSDPQGDTLYRSRENSNKVLEKADQNTAEISWAGSRQRRQIVPPEIIDLTGEIEPDHDSNSVEILDHDFIVLGPPRAVVDIHKDKATTRAGIKREEGEASQYSSGEAHGNGKDTGYASIHAKPTFESQGILRDMWNAMQFLKKKHSQITSVEWFTWETGFQTENEPQLIPLRKLKETADTSAKTWLFFDKKLNIVRGILAARMIISQRAVYFIEIQRRARNKIDETGNSIEAEEAFKGIVCSPKSEAEFKIWLEHILSEVRHVKGIVQKITGSFTTPSKAYTHPPSKEGQMACEASVLNALRKIGITL